MYNRIMRTLISFLCLLPLCVGGANAESIADSVFSLFNCVWQGFASMDKTENMIVGTDIAIEDITDFYYTYATSTNPPDYQRYRFYVEDGAHFFYHEKREGDHWPLKEADITISGTVELSEEKWIAFFDHLCGGQVKKREESDEDGDSGPWLYLYWNGDGSVYQEYSFPSRSEEYFFETYCVALAESQ